MAQILFRNEADISNDWLFYIENEAKALAQRDDFAIQNYLDREIFNPEMQNYLSSDDVGEMLNAVNETQSLNLNFTEGLKISLLPNWLWPRFRKLKTKVKQIFCNVVNGDVVGEIDTMDIISAVILALIPAFAGGFLAIILPIVIGLVAYLLKYGIERTCPA